MSVKIASKFPFRKEFIKSRKTRQHFIRYIEVPFDYKLGGVLIIDEVSYPIYNIWQSATGWYTFFEGRTVHFTEEQILNSTVHYTKVK